MEPVNDPRSNLVRFEVRMAEKLALSCCRNITQRAETEMAAVRTRALVLLLEVSDIVVAVIL